MTIKSPNSFLEAARNMKLRQWRKSYLKSGARRMKREAKLALPKASLLFVGSMIFNIMLASSFAIADIGTKSELSDSDVSGPASQAQTNEITFIFGDTKLKIDRSVLRSLPHPPAHAFQKWDDISVWRVPKGQSVEIKPEFPLSLPNNSECRKIYAISLRHVTIPPLGKTDGSGKSENIVPTEYRSVSAVIPSTGPQSSDQFQFELDDLRNYWNEKQRFRFTSLSRGRELTHVNIQLTRDLNIATSISRRHCFFEYGAGIVRHFRKSIQMKIVRS